MSQLIDCGAVSGSSLFRQLERYVLTKEQLKCNGYPLQHPHEQGRAVINAASKVHPSPQVRLVPNQRLCDRCATIYEVDNKGFHTSSVKKCSYHFGKPYPRPGGARYSCCNGSSSSAGCCEARYHVCDTTDEETLNNFVRTQSNTSMTPSDGNYGIYSLDCEMCYTTKGRELIRVSVVATDGRSIYESFVQPDNPIVDYNTRFSGVSERDLMHERTTIRDVQAVLLAKFSSETILIGHSLDNDLRALRIIHDTVIDTTLVFPHSRGLPYKKALRTLALDILRKTIQKSNGGHDSTEDAIACMELMIWKVKKDLNI